MGGATVGATIFLPLFLQVVLGASASNSGLLITPLMVGITIGALLTGRFIRWTGRYKIIPLLSLTIAALSFLGMMEVTRATSPISDLQSRCFFTGPTQRAEARVATGSSPTASSWPPKPLSRAA